MKISACVRNSAGRNDILLNTNGTTHSLTIAPKSSGFGSSANGGELLFLALATCYCNDVYREAARRGIEVSSVEVAVEGDFGTEGAPARNVTYRATVASSADEVTVRAMLQETDRVAEIQNTLRVETPVRLTRIDIVGQ